jgi:hypothetical protein
MVISPYENPNHILTLTQQSLPDKLMGKATPEYNLAVIHPKVAKEWHKTKNNSLTSKDVVSGSSRKVWWKCNKGHEWEASIGHRSRGTSCPECSGRRVGKDNNLSVKFPKVTKEWHPSKNKPLTPKDVTPGSNKKVWWKCGKGHEWLAMVIKRSSGRGCPECSGNKVGKDNNLFIKFPKIAKEWHPSKNKPLTPEDVLPGSNKKVWWKCGKGHEWLTMVNHRSRGRGCPKCYETQRGSIITNAAIKRSGHLKDKFPKIAEEWHPNKNKNLTPKDVSPGSKKKVWWKCGKGHEWLTSIYKRSGGTGCPICRPKVSKIQIQIFCELKTIFKDILLGKVINKMECDIYLPRYKVAIEYDGNVWHKGQEKRDKKKYDVLNKEGVTLFRIRERYLKKISSNDVLVDSGDSPISIIKKILAKLTQKYLFSSIQNNKIQKYILETKLRNIKEYNELISHLPGCLPQDSLKLNFPKISKEWNFKRNNPLQPEWFSYGSGSMVWWQCNKGHEWETTISTRSSGSGCPECSGRRVGKDNNLFIKFAKIAKEWHPTKNKPLTPKDVVSGSSRKVWWKCGKGHEWLAMVAKRSSGRGCPECSGNKVGEDNNLFIKFPKIAKEWHPSKNKPLTPEDVLPGSNKKVWWKCGKGHEWLTMVNHRLRGSGCPECSGQKVGKDNNLLVKFPKVAKEWHPTKNKNLTPKDVTSGSDRKIWWQCNKGHEWKTSIGHRSRGTSCPECNKERRKLGK